jgi:NAD-dependent SIR2 family protein deacetylase
MAHEYLDTREVLQEKARMFAGLLRQARRAVIYAGAGLSTASGVGDYATRTGGKSVALASSVSTGFMSPYDATPNLGHRVIAALASAGFLWRVVQQNHDGLLQKAGVPQQLINEIHGSWFDPGNPVLKFDEYLREDLNEDLEVVESTADLVIVLGSSLAGMNADRIVSACARRALNEEVGILGSVIVSIQRTPQDAASSLRIFATIDSMMELLAAELSLEVAPVQDSAVPELHNALANEVDVYSVPYDSDGNLLEDGSQQFLDLREGAELTVTVGNDKGQRAIVVGKHPEGHFKLNVKRSDTYGGVVAVRYFGKWWVRAALLGQLQHIPLSTSVKPAS